MSIERLTLSPHSLAGRTGSANGASLDPTTCHGGLKPRDAAAMLRKQLKNAARAERRIAAFVPGKLIGPSSEIHASAGPLAGIAWAAKDNIETSDFPADAGFPAAPCRGARRNAPIVQLITGLGATLIGKSAMAEFALYSPPATRNPLDPRLTPGGSSSGSAAAVASGQVAFAIGTQTAGSVIRPAAFCGVAAISFSHGLFSNEGILPLAPSLDTIGVFAARAQDVARIAHAMLRMPIGKVLPARIAVCENWTETPLSSGVRDGFHEAVVRLRQSGVSIVEVELPAPLVSGHRAHMSILGFEAARTFDALPALRRAQASDRLRDYIDECRQISKQDYELAQDKATAARRAYSDFIQPFDLLLTPSANEFAPDRRAATTGSSIMNRVWTLLSTPAANVPFWPTGSPLPIGLQIIGRHRHDLDLVACAAAIERLLGHHWEADID